MPPELISLAGTLIGGLFGAWIGASLFGAWIGASLAFQRYRREKAFERRLVWYETCFSALAQVRKNTYQLLHALQPGTDAEVLTQRANNFGQTFEELADALEHGVFYAPPTTLKTLRRLQDHIKGFTDRLAAAPPSHVTDAQALVGLGNELLLASRRLADDIRPHLGLRRLPPGIGPADA